jgi:putative tributyrin esterase
MSNFFTTEISPTTADGLCYITLKSNALKKRADLTVYIPEHVKEIAGVVILLHGVYGSHWAWALKGNVHKITQKLIDEKQLKPMILVMPSDGLFGDGSAYLPHKTEDYEKWIVEDVIEVVREQIDLVKIDTPHFIAGLSMGGFGAMRLGTKYSHIFKAFSGLSSITEFSQLKLFVEDFESLDNNVLSKTSILDEILAKKDDLSPFRFDCGTDDTLVTYNRALHNSLEKHQISHIYQEFSGEHSWEYWTSHIAETLLFFNQFC